MNSWAEITGANEDYSTLERAASAPLPQVPDTHTELVDLATEAAAPKPYVAVEDAPKPFVKRKEEGTIAASTPVNIYEPGFRSDLYEAITNYFQKQRAIKERNKELRQKLGMRG